jgi:hypothetical protein
MIEIALDRFEVTIQEFKRYHTVGDVRRTFMNRLIGYFDLLERAA